jgi:hypothetical protein
MDYKCENCGKKLNPDKMVWLELDREIGEWFPPGIINPLVSQGEFHFGKDCAQKVLDKSRKNPQYFS